MLHVRHAFMNKSVSSTSKQQEALASTTETAMTTPYIENLIGWRQNKCAIRAARTYEEVPATLCKQQSEIAIFTVLMTT